MAEQGRSCYTTPAHFLADDSTPLTLRWYFTAEGAAWFPYPSAFSMQAWEKPGPFNYPVGPFTTAHTFDRGVNRGYTGSGCVEGQPAWFVMGQPASASASGSFCCLAGLAGVGGLGLGGDGYPVCLGTEDGADLLTEGRVNCVGLERHFF